METSPPLSQIQTFPKISRSTALCQSATVVSVCGSLIALNQLGHPGRTGFWCHDESISLPYKDDSISKHLLLTMAFGAPLFVILLTEIVRLASGNKKTRAIKAQLQNAVKAYAVFMFGMAADMLLTEMLKYAVGRLRPHFLDVCKPHFDHTNCSSIVWPKVRSKTIGRHRHTSQVFPTAHQTAFQLDLPGACADVKDYDALVVVHSAIDHFRHRKDYRETYGNPDFTQPYRLKVIFFVGLSVRSDLQSDVALEHSHHRDVIQANFVDSYFNLTLKAIAVFRWLVEKCPPPPLIVKMDDDVLLDIHRLFEEFSTMPPYHDEFVIHCHSWEAAVVNRDGKWGVSALQYPLDSYPDYCSGFLVLLKLPAVEELYYVGTTEYCISGTTVLYNQYNNVLYYRCLGLSRQCQSSTAQVILTST
ncbi:hypothetical protein RRG08_007922 [Elysia crispata]|uniref:Hexosyltransferase n=1 Tax=Elysia crispata TaxID=231223 RepID=A0AAE0ZQH2_9GAST|nr:hypothetical protein RRG08_007922 [Elysia crispata]